jgi:hypothetical protein
VLLNRGIKEGEVWEVWGVWGGWGEGLMVGAIGYERENHTVNQQRQIMIVWIEPAMISKYLIGIAYRR